MFLLAISETTVRLSLLPLRIIVPPACRYEGAGSRFVGSQFIFRFDFQVKIFNNSYFMLTSLSAYLRVSRLLMITRLGIWLMTVNPKAKSENFSLRKNSSLRTLSYCGPGTAD